VSEGAGRRRRWRWRRRRPRKERRRFDLRKALFILPNAFTVSSIFCGLYAILLATHEGGSHIPGANEDPSFGLYQAAIAIFFAGFFDLFDGRIARMTKTQSDFGVQMDSLADSLSFGVAPAVLVYKWALQPLGVLGMIGAFAVAACGTIRLARFNVLAARGEGSSNYFVGLPIPVSAAMIVSLVIAHHVTLGTEVERRWSVLAFVLILSYLMVSNVRYPTFKNFKPNAKNLPVVLGLLGAGVAVTVLVHASVALVLLVGGYIFTGLLSEVLRYFRKDGDTGHSEPAHAKS
jgi:CDP-diacylglycerol--serine O-phosphatidyltransferase